MDRQTPPEGRPPGMHPVNTANLRAVHILLECILARRTLSWLFVQASLDFLDIEDSARSSIALLHKHPEVWDLQAMLG